MILAISRLYSQLCAAGIPIDGVSGGTADTVRVDFQASATQAQQTQGAAIVAEFDWSRSAAATFDAQQEKTAAAASIDRGELVSGSASDRLVFALVTMMLDELNAHSTFEASLLSAIAAATTLADLKARMSTMNQIPQRTKAQVMSILKAKISATGE
jgi:hypothetical protein